VKTRRTRENNNKIDVQTIGIELIYLFGTGRSDWFCEHSNEPSGLVSGGEHRGYKSEH
jgi:hypothetical protein